MSPSFQARHLSWANQLVLEPVGVAGLVGANRDVCFTCDHPGLVLSPSHLARTSPSPEQDVEHQPDSVLDQSSSDSSAGQTRTDPS